MSNTVTFYRITDDSAVLNKSLTEDNTLATMSTVKVKGNCGILHPSLVLKYEASIAAANYCYIDDPYNRYYFLSPPVLSPGGRMTFTGTVDALMSWGSEIASLPVYVSRKEGIDGSPYRFLADPTLPCTCGNVIHTAQFKNSPFLEPDGADDYRYILTVVGGLNQETP